MKLPDANVLLYAMDRRSVQHESARTWLDHHLSGTETIAFAWVVLLAFIRLATKAAVFESPLTIGDAVDVVQGWLAQPPATVVHPTARHLDVLAELLGPLGTGGNLVNDAHLAALAVEHGAVVASFDADFRRFPRVQTEYLARGR